MSESEPPATLPGKPTWNHKQEVLGWLKCRA